MRRSVALILALVVALAGFPASQVGTSAQDATPGAGLLHSAAIR